MGDVKATVTEEMVGQLALLAQLQIDPARLALVVEELDGLLSGANVVNRLMDDRREVGLSIKFHHPEPVAAK